MTLRAVSHLPANHGKGKPVDTIPLTKPDWHSDWNYTIDATPQTTP